MDILIVEDEREIAELIQLYLSKEGFNCHICRDGSAALDRFKTIQPDLMILDLMLPGLDGLEVCARIRQQQAVKDPYIMMLTAKGEELDRIIGLSTGADDYMVKPFSPRELVARVRAVLRRSLRGGATGDGQGASKNAYETAHFTLDIDRRLAVAKRSFEQSSDIARTYEEEVTQNGSENLTSPEKNTLAKNAALPSGSQSRSRAGEAEIQAEADMSLELTPLEFDLLSTFMSYPGRVWNRAQLIEKLWGGDFFGDERVVDAHIARLRKKIEPNPAQPTFIKTVVGVGYRFEDEVT